MQRKIGDKILCRMPAEAAKLNATVVGVLDSNEGFRIQLETPHAPSEGDSIVIFEENVDTICEVLAVEGNEISVRPITSEKRDYFRVDDILPVIATKINKDPATLKPRVVSGFGSTASYNDLLDESINPNLWKILVDINNKLNQLMDRLVLQGEGLSGAEEKPVNLSVSGIRFIANEPYSIADTAELKLFLPTRPPACVVLYGTVTRVVNITDRGCEIALSFFELESEVKNLLTQYMLKRQREIIRKQSGFDS